MPGSTCLMTQQRTSFFLPENSAVLANSFFHMEVPRVTGAEPAIVRVMMHESPALVRASVTLTIDLPERQRSDGGRRRRQPPRAGESPMLGEFASPEPRRYRARRYRPRHWQLSCRWPASRPGPGVDQAPALGRRAKGRLQMVRKRSVLALRFFSSARLARGRGWSQMVGMRSVVMVLSWRLRWFFGKCFHISCRALYLRPRS